ncbi:uncharacterized protein LOC143291754 isoform X6 [Babylonia areolata]|uniref:uncharacterized protein LOC143291754 isoform X6 n=1 Tax=Babylonia areolata TaxID=304850 RepID=UPI003FD301CE
MATGWWKVNSGYFLITLSVVFGAVCGAVSHENGLSWTPFQGFHEIQQLQCSGEVLPADAKLFYMVLYELPQARVLGQVIATDKVCKTSEAYTLCEMGVSETRKTKLKALVADLPEGRSRKYGCNVTALFPDGGVQILTWSVAVYREARTTTTVAPTTTTTTTTTIKPQPRSESPVASGVKSNVQEFQLPISVVIIGLVLLLFFAILCAILVILQCRGKRRRRSRAANRESLLSAKNEPMGEGGYRTPRNIPSYPPGHMPPETPGGNFAMRYQKSIPDTGYVSGSSVYYSEPYGTLDEEMKERLRPNPRMCHIPYDIKGGPLDTSHPQEHSA